MIVKELLDVLKHTSFCAYKKDSSRNGCANVFDDCMLIFVNEYGEKITTKIEYSKFLKTEEYKTIRNMQVEAIEKIVLYFDFNDYVCITIAVKENN